MTIKKPIIRHGYTPVERVTLTTGEGLTKQNHKPECDVNLIMAKYQKTGIVTHRNEYEAQYDDATGIDFQEAMNLVISAQNMFNDLPSQVRKKFDHKPEKFMEFVNDPNNQSEMIEMGLATGEVPVSTPPTQPTETTTTETPPEAV